MVIITLLILQTIFREIAELEIDLRKIIDYLFMFYY
jgi:hypothetical protein